LVDIGFKRLKVIIKRKTTAKSSLNEKCAERSWKNRHFCGS